MFFKVFLATLGVFFHSFHVLIRRYRFFHDNAKLTSIPAQAPVEYDFEQCIEPSHKLIGDLHGIEFIKEVLKRFI